MRGSHYTDEQNQFIVDHGDMQLKELADAFNKRFCKTVSKEAMGKKRKALGLPPVIVHTETMFTEGINNFLLENYERFTSRELAKKIAVEFGVEPKTQTVTDQLLRLGIRRGNCFTPKGYVPRASKPIGSERVDKNRTVMVKTGQPNEWRPKAQVVMNYDPKNEQVIYLDGNSLNVTKENMVVVSKRVHARLAKNGWLNSSSEIVLAGIKWAELLYAIKKFEEEGVEDA